MTRSTSSLRRTATTVALAGAAVFGTVALAPAASAAQSAPPAVDGASYTVPGKSNGGPSWFLVTDHGRKPIFFCEDDKPNKRQNNCQADPVAAPDRF